MDSNRILGILLGLPFSDEEGMDGVIKFREKASKVTAPISGRSNGLPPTTNVIVGVRMENIVFHEKHHCSVKHSTHTEKKSG